MPTSISAPLKVSNADKEIPNGGGGTKRVAAQIPGAFPSSDGSSSASKSIFAGLFSNTRGASTTTPAGHHGHSSEVGTPQGSDLSSLLAAADADAKPEEEEEENDSDDDDDDDDDDSDGDDDDDEDHNKEEEKEDPEPEPAAAEAAAATDPDAKSKTNKESDSNSDGKDWTIPSWIPSDVYRKAEDLQDTLLNLILMAEDHGLIELFNEAMDAFRAGEKQLARVLPSRRHIKLCCAHERKEHFRSSDPSLATCFMFDYAYALGVTHRQMKHYAELVREEPSFAAAMLSRLDGEVEEVPGFQAQGGVRTSQGGGGGPLDPFVNARYQYAVEK